MVSVTLYRYSFNFRYALNDRQMAGFDPGRAFVEIYAVDTPEGRDERGWTCLDRRTATRSIRVEATDGESAAWARAQTAALDALWIAEQQLVHDVGMRIEGGFSPGLRRGSGWSAARRRSRTASRQAFDRLEQRLHDIAERYRPVREQIEPRVHEADARAQEEQARLWKAQREREKRDDRFTELAARTRWSYRVTESDRTVHAFRADDSTLTTGELIDELQRPTHHLTGYTVHWAAADRAEIEHVSGADFTTWWAVVAPGHWNDSRRIPSRPSTRSGPYIGGHSSYGGGTSCGGGFSSCGGGF
ncbi:hypothetical protein ACLMAJ_24680 [Nocardia sp. KC 131]|uniref:hypothetical protein n=1 Tax=Nocardia arseniciresistens TaxID=3392119 RepID=UPI00398F606A